MSPVTGTDRIPEAPGPVFRMDPTVDYVPSGPKARFAANIAAIERVRSLEASGRTATAEDQTVLSGWSSWGAVADVFDTSKDNWAGEREQLRSLLNDEEWEAAKATTINAHYTSPAIVEAMWGAVTGLGVSQARVLEPGCGSGNFIGTAPEGMSMVGVELDPLTASIATHLYPNAEIKAESFGKTTVRPGHYDAAIANVPFGSFPVFDPTWNPGERFSIHNHFLRKAVGGLHDGGVAVMMSSAYTMDAQNPAFRAEISREADFLGAVRLPNGTHRRAAGTEVVTDVLVFRKRMVGEEPTSETLRWVKAVPTEIAGERAQPLMNRYSHDHPDNVLGTVRVSSFRDGQIDVVADDLDAVAGQLERRLQAVVEHARDRGREYVPVTAEMRAEREQAQALAPQAGLWPGSIVEVDGEFFLTKEDSPEQLKVPKNAAEELRSLMDLRDRAGALIEGQVSNPVDTDEIIELRAATHTAWQAHVARFGPVNRHTLGWKTETVTDDDTGEQVKVRVQTRKYPKAIQLMKRDPMWSLTAALEVYNEETGQSHSAAILHQRTVEQTRPLLGADTAEEALALCLDARGRAELDRIAALLGTDEATAREQLSDLVFDDPATGQLATRAEYLSGNVRTKLDQATAASEEDERFLVNVAALKEVIPADIPLEDIVPTIGAVWIGEKDHQDFLQLIARDRHARVVKAGGFWEVQRGAGDARQSVAATSEWGTARMPVYDLYLKLLGGKEIQVHDTDEDGKRTLNPAESEAARAKADEITQRFEEWVWEDPARTERLLAEYNRRFNSLVTRDYTADAARLTFPGMKKDFTPHDHQRTAVARMIAEPAVGMFHSPGAGKTNATVMGLMELKRRGLVQKPMTIVPGHMLEQFTREWQDLYPNARLLSAGSDDLKSSGGSVDGRRDFIAKATTGDWDGIIMTHAAFGKLGIKETTATAYFSKVTAELEAAEMQMREKVGKDRNRGVKAIESRKKTQQARLEKVVAAADDTNLTFEDTGIDYLAVDEAHLFKNLHVSTSIAGAQIDGSLKAADLDMKLDYLRATYGARVVTLATGTPIANSIAEAYVVTKYLRPDLLDEAGVGSFDEWGATFGETITRIERDAAGRLKQKSRFAKFKNIPEMLSSWHQFADTKRTEDLNLNLPDLAVNEAGERRPEMVVIPRTDSHAQYMEFLEQRLDALSGTRPEKGADNHLTVYADGRKVALDPRLVGMDTGGEVKLDYVARRIGRIWKENRDNEYTVPGTQEISEHRGALQLVFCDLATPNDEEWNAYDQIKSALVTRHGMDRSRIAFIHDAKDDEQRAKLFKAAREGGLDVLIGSSEKMGTGANIQNRAIAMHHVDCPWRPDMLEQRDGRILRQGNENPEIQIYRYATENTFDSTSWDIITRKASAIAQVMRGRLDVRELDDPGDMALDAQQLMAASSGNPLLMERTELDVTVQKLARRSRGHDRAQEGLKFRKAAAEQRRMYLNKALPTVEAAVARRVDTRGEAFKATIDGRVYDERKKASRAIYELMSRSMESTRMTGQTVRGIRIGGLDAEATVILDEASHSRQIKVTLLDTGAGVDASEVIVAFPMDWNTNESKIKDVAHLVENKVIGLDRVLGRMQTNKAELDAEVESIDGQLGKPFKQADELQQARQQLAEIDRKIAEADTAENGRKTEPDNIDEAVNPHGGGVGTSETTAAADKETKAVAGVSVDDTVGPTPAEQAADSAKTVEKANGVRFAGLSADEADQTLQVRDREPKPDPSGRADTIARLISERLSAAAQTYQAEAEHPLRRAAAMTTFWRQTSRCTKELASAARGYDAASDEAPTEAHANLLQAKKQLVIFAMNSIGRAHESKVPAQFMTDAFLAEQMPRLEDRMRDQHEYRIAAAAGADHMVEYMKALRMLETTRGSDGLENVSLILEGYDEELTTFRNWEAEAQGRLGKAVPGAALADRARAMSNPEEQKLMTGWVRASSVLAKRLTPDEMATALGQSEDAEQANKLSELIERKPYHVAGVVASVAACHGVLRAPDHGLTDADASVEERVAAQNRHLDRAKTELEEQAPNGSAVPAGASVSVGAQATVSVGLD